MADRPRFEPVGERELHRSRLLSVAVGRFRGPDGAVFERDVVHHPGWVAVLPLAEDGQVVMVRQYRPALDRWLLEIPAGIRDVEGETEEQTARRELAEEVGLAAGRLERMAVLHNSPGFTDEQGTVYLATDLAEVASDAQGAEEEHMTVERIPLSDAVVLVERGEITDVKTVVAVLHAALNHPELAGGPHT